MYNNNKRKLEQYLYKTFYKYMGRSDPKLVSNIVEYTLATKNIDNIDLALMSNDPEYVKLSNEIMDAYKTYAEEQIRLVKNFTGEELPRSYMERASALIEKYMDQEAKTGWNPISSEPNKRTGYSNADLFMY